MNPAPLVRLDGPMGTGLVRRGIDLPGPLWTAVGVAEHPELVVAVHAEYAAAGARVHTAASFRTTARSLRRSPYAARWAELAARAVALCRQGAGQGGRVAGSMAPLEDCYRPDLTPDDEALAAEHGALARTLADAGADLLLVEAMPSLRELAAATSAAVATGLPVWCAVTLGPAGDFFTPAQVREGAGLVADLGAEAYGVNCTPPQLITPLLDHLAGATHRPAQLLAYGNAIFSGHAPLDPAAYLDHARAWRAAGAQIIGTCCGTTPAHLAALDALD